MSHNILTSDFETFFQPPVYTLSNDTTAGYVRDERFQTIGVGVRWFDGATEWMEDAEFREFIQHVDWSTTAVLAHHTHFDGFILAERYGVRPVKWLDTLSMGRALYGVEVGGSLGKLAEKLGVGVKGHATEWAKGKRREDFTPEQWAEYGAYCCNDVELCWRLWELMSKGFPEDELDLIDVTIRMYTEPKVVLDGPMLEEYLEYERARKAELLARVSQEATDVRSDAKFAALLEAEGVPVPLKWSVKQKKEVPAFAKTDPGFLELLEHENDYVRALAAARKGVKTTINESRTTRFLDLGQNGTAVPLYLKYAGAHTFRWSGSDKINPQNLERVDKSDPRKGVLRKATMAPDGDMLVVADSAAIEARTLAWEADEQWLLEAFAEGRDVYSEFASVVFDRPISKANKRERAAGKSAVLGLGYGMGWYKAAITFAAGPMGNPPIIFTADEAKAMNVDVESFRAKNYERVVEMPSRLPIDERCVHAAVCEKLVTTYRKKNPAIVRFWKTAESIIVAMCDAEEGDEVPFLGGAVVAVRHGLGLPNGMVMKYPGLEPSGDDGFEYLVKGRGPPHKVHLYGGLMTENITQALARIIVADQMLAAHRAGYHTVLMTHDEIVLCVPEATAQEALEFLLKEMRTAPVWAPDLPLDAEGAVTKRYGDAK